MKMLLIALATVMSAHAFSAVPAKVTAAAVAMKATDVKTVVTAVKNAEGNPCLPAGTSYNVDLKVKQAAYNRETRKMVYTWETVKTINVSKGGQVMEVCAE